MVKLKISAIEKKLGFKLKRNIKVIGVDTASTSGMAYFKVDKSTLSFQTEKLKFGAHKKGTPINTKLNTGIGAIKDYAKKIGKVNLIVLENAYLGANKYTYGLLRMIAGIFYCNLAPITKELIFYYATESRKIVGFNSKKMKGTALKKLVVSWVEGLGFGKLSHDEADAVLLALAGIVIQPLVQQKLKKVKKVKK